jgi:hypothetical protein
MLDLYSKELPEGALHRLFTQVSQDAKSLLDKDSYLLPDVCADGKVIPLAAMNDDFSVVLLLQLALGIKK